MSDYLWDKEGEPDADVAHLEQALAPLRHRARALPPLPSRGTASPRPRVRRRWLVTASALAVAAVVALLVIARPWAPARGWDRVGGGRLAVDTWLDTGATPVALRAGTLGTVELGAGTRARIVETGGAQERIEIARGTLAARIDAAPRRFAVAMPHAIVTDLGCAFTVTVDEGGRGRVVVREGRVAIAAAGGAEIVVPAGAQSDVSEAGASAPVAIGAQTATPIAPTPTPTPTPIAPTPSAPATATPTVAPPTATPHAPKHGKRAAHTTPHAAAAHATPTRAPAPTRKPATAPARKPDAQPHLSHDPLKDLERSVE